MVRKKTIVELTRVAVEAPLVDGVEARKRRLGLFSTFTAAATWVQRVVAEDSPEAAALLYYEATEVVLDYRERFCRSRVYDRDGSIRGETRGGVGRPWGGREPSTCRFEPGQLVAHVGYTARDVYRVGVVLAQPVSPDEARRMGNMVTVGDDRYLVGLVDRDDPFDPDRYDHEHVAEATLFAVENEMPRDLRGALQHRCLGTPGFPPWTEEAQRAMRDPDAVISHVLARFHRDDERTSGSAGSTRAMLVLDDGVGYLKAALGDANFQVVDLTNHASDIETRTHLMSHRMLVTKNTADFLDLAPVLDTGIIGLDALPRLHGEVEYYNNPTVQLISRAAAEFGLVGQRGGWVILLHPDGKHAFRRIE